MTLIADERTVPRIHLIGTIVILSCITLGLAVHFSWLTVTEERATLARLQQVATEHVMAELEATTRNALDVIGFIRSRTEENLRRSLTEQVDTAYQIAESLYAMESAGKPRGEVERLIVETLRPLRFYDGRGYYFIDDLRGRFVLLPIEPGREGTINLDNRDDQGRPIMRGLIDAAKRPRGEGFYRYRWYAPDDPRQMSDKLAYVRYFAPYDWVIGAGDYLAPWDQRQQQEALRYLGSMRLGTHGRISVVASNGYAVLSHADPSLTGKRHADLPPPQRRAIDQILDKARAGGGIVQYQWPTKNGAMLPKTAFVTRFEPWDWVLVVNTFDDAIQDAVEEEIRTNQATPMSVHNLSLALAVTLALGLMASLLFSRWSQRLFRRYHEEHLARTRALAEYRDALEQLIARRSAELEAANHALRETFFALDNASIAVHWVDAATARLLYVNDAACQMLGYSRDALLRLTVPDIDPNYPRERFEALTRIAEEAPATRFESLNRRRDGSLFPVEVFRRLRPGDEDGQAPKFIAFVTDISARKADEQALEQAKEAAETANRAKSAFLANMSHEIRTPLNAITGLAYMIRSSGVTAQQADWLDKLDAAGRHLLEIINAILDLSKIEAGRLELESIPFDVQSVIGSVLEMIAPQARAKGLRLRMQTDEAPRTLIGDPTRLQQALLNYASNAVKFTSAGEVTMRAWTLEQSADSVLLRFEVTDTGIGIAPEVIGRLFADFEQADNSTTRQFGGTGLGLAITQRLAHLMGGETGVSSAPGAGSTFWFSARCGLPATAAGDLDERLAGDALSRLIRDLPGHRVLVVEDEPINQEIARFLLEDAGQVVEVAGDGAAAVELVARHAYDLILMDLQLPALDGLEATHRIRALPGHATTPIIAMTANAFSEDRQTCLQTGMNDFVAKPIDPDALYQMLLKWLSMAKGI